MQKIKATLLSKDVSYSGLYTAHAAWSWPLAAIKKNVAKAVPIWLCALHTLCLVGRLYDYYAKGNTQPAASKILRHEV
jgi:hypothetical protein